jgi:tRNA (guanine-N7-)-methyltransferase
MMHRRIKSYVLRAGRVSKRQQLGLDQWLKDYELKVDSNHWNYSTVFSQGTEVVVEIGFGMGASLISMAMQNPNLNYIGIEVHQAGVGSLVAALHEHQLTNVKVVFHDAVEVMQTQIMEHSLAGIHIFFPDPWHKKRHHKRRLIQKEFVALLATRVKPGGYIHCATDWQDYAEHMLEVFSAEPALYNQQEGGGYSPRPSARPLTKFERRGERLGHGVWDLIFVKR